ncbi:MAG: hypothetical protein KDC26_02830 [Armatimonadetes bacterium]|nr:hypothetical protein [Armatimonadota bacterium]
MKELTPKFWIWGVAAPTLCGVWYWATLRWWDAQTGLAYFFLLVACSASSIVVRRAKEWFRTGFFIAIAFVLMQAAYQLPRKDYAQGGLYCVGIVAGCIVMLSSNFGDSQRHEEKKSEQAEKA